MTFTIQVDDLTDPRLIHLLEEHLREMRLVSPPESVHALDLRGLKQPEITFWSAWEDGELAGCGALKALSGSHAELKSMRTAPNSRRRGVGALLLQHILAEAKSRGFRRVSLETGAQPFFEPARRLYKKHGFEECPPFGDYQADPNSVFMTREI